MVLASKSREPAPKMLGSSKQIFKLVAILMSMLVLLDSLAIAGEKGRDIIIWNGKVILKGGKKKGNIIISNGEHGGGMEHYGKSKSKKKYMNYGGFW